MGHDNGHYIPLFIQFFFKSILFIVHRIATLRQLSTICCLISRDIAVCLGEENKYQIWVMVSVHGKHVHSHR